LQKVLRIDRKLYQIDKPGLAASDNVSLNKEDLLILCAGFEDRVMTCLNLAMTSGKTGFSVVLIDYLPYVNENKTEEIKKKCNRGGITVHHITYDRQNPQGMGNKILGVLKPEKGGIFVDISGMSRLLIVQILNVLGNAPFNFREITILYTIARKYPPSQKDVDSEIMKMEKDSFYSTMFLSSGIFELAIDPELSSASFGGQPIRVVAFPSFNPDQLAALRFEVQASSFTLIHGIPPLEENSWRPEKINILNRVKDISNREEIKTSTLNYEDTLEALLDIYNEHGVLERIIVAPTGSKMQTVAVGILRAFMEDIQIVYPTPRLFPKPNEYTTGAGQIYQLQLDSFSEIRES
jgi:hypothetical protein